MTTYNRGDVVLVPFPFTSQGQTKQRPALVVSVFAYNDSCPDVILASITSNPNPLTHVGDHRIVAWQAAGLDDPSIVQAKLVTVENGIIQQKIGELQPQDLSQYEQGLRTALGL
ncbi:MAG TPA: type II toxin-antitoxin system PemK/MazF family toxin [Chloroflexi bacterium]|jgi:mRNA interferase MazF|nr:type II toxin-antitoxin system PemK/MazF family toxin [Chloroflexota bacterium]